MAVFPNGVVAFTQKHDLLDPVMAADVNRIQDEIVAIEQSLGADLNEVHQVQQIVTQQGQTQQILTSQQAAQNAQILAQQGSLNNLSLAQQQTIQRYNSLKDQLAALAANQNVFAFEGSGSSYGTNAAASLSNPWTIPVAASYDPLGMFNGTGCTLPVSGLWRVEAYVGLNPGVQGLYHAGIMLGGNPWGIEDEVLLKSSAQGNWPGAFLKPARTLWMSAGTTVSLTVGTDSPGTGGWTTWQDFSLAAYRIRG